ncbi:MAG: hypothetical protein ACRDJS_02935 [Actinomycetota bacterium]
MAGGFKVTDLVLFGKEFAVPKRFTGAMTIKALPYRVEIDVSLKGERFLCEALRAERKKGGPPVTSEGIRKLPVGELIRTAALAYIHRVKANPKEKGSVIITPTRLTGFERFASSGATDEALEYVALVYRLAYACNDSPTKAVMDAFGLPRATAGRWIASARERGFLGKSLGERKPGAAPTRRRK